MEKRPILEKFRKGDLVQYLNNVLEIITVERATELKVDVQRQALADVMQKFNASWQPNKGSELTPQIQKLDEQRDSLFLGLKNTVETWALHHYDDEKKNAAFLMIDKFETYGKMLHKLRYQQETATINSLVADFTTELSNEVTLLDLTEWVQKLGATNVEFNEKYLERAKALSTEQEGIVLQLRTEATEAFQVLKNIFEARMAIAKVEGVDVDKYQNVDNELSEITEQYNQAVLNNVGSNQKEDEAN